MAPEIMQLQKYDAKADLWSVGAILFQLVTGKTPFTGSNQIQLLQNIVKSTELQFPPDRRNLSSECIDLCRKLLRRNPVERLTFEEFFNHPFLSQRQSNELLRNRRSPKTIVGFPFSERSPVRNAEEGSQEDNLPFSLDDVSNGSDRSPSFVRKPSMKSTVGFSVGDRKEVPTTSNNMDLSSKFSSVAHKPENTSLRLDSRIPSEGNLKESFKSADRRPMDTHPRVVDSLELFDQEYVIVSGPPMDVSSSPPCASKLSHLPCNSGSPQQEFANMNSAPSAPMPIIGATGSRFGCSGSLDSHSSAPSGTSQGSMEIGDALEQPSPHCITRIKSLKRCASAVTELVNEKMESRRQLEAFSIQLVTLAIWKQALHICHTQAIEGSPTQEMARLRESPNQEHGSLDIASTHGPQELCSQIEREFLNEVGNAEELAKLIEPGNTEMPDAMETIYQSALALGRHGAVDEYMGDTENAAVRYSKAVHLLVFLLVEAPSLILNPPFSLTNSDRHRLRNYIDVLNNRQSHSRSQRMALLQGEDQQCPP
ncbi:serine/threonine-protein kinase ATG1c-like isoform X2 [Rhododendron vialii]|nr:serine/threonine-protein kinase ATG1c-like isoform X2 [Rhododendron vialii]